MSYGMPNYTQYTTQQDRNGWRKAIKLVGRERDQSYHNKPRVHPETRTTDCLGSKKSNLPEAVYCAPDQPDSTGIDSSEQRWDELVVAYNWEYIIHSSCKCQA
jgi:hypothetical protein